MARQANAVREEMRILADEFSRLQFQQVIVQLLPRLGDGV